MGFGLIHIYTGEGKGKTTSSIGLILRALANDKKVKVIQFLKGRISSEYKILNTFSDKFKLYTFEKNRGFTWELNSEQLDELKNEIKEAFSFGSEIMKDKQCDLLVLDELMAAINSNFIEVKDVVKALKQKNEGIEVVMTGRNAPKELIEIADYVSNIQCIKHPFEKGTNARQGIEF